MSGEPKTILHVGCGAYAPGKLHAAFREPAWREIRLDIDPAVQPDVVASITDMSPVESASVDAIYSAHNLEHLYPHEVPLALREFRRVLKPCGVALITLPDLQSIAQRIVEADALEPAYLSQLGPITPLDMLYGFLPALAGGNLYMAHHTAFTGRTLLAHLADAGFAYSVAQRHVSAYSLWAIGFAEMPDEAAIGEAKERMLPLDKAVKEGVLF
jgi:SAM-dependent methyltransferase